MAKTKLQYQCTECGSLHSKWSGQCADCGAWNTLQEYISPSAGPRNARPGGYAGMSANVTAMSEVALEADPRSATQIDELDRVLGGGLVHGSVVLLGGDPGIGKSTLLLQTLAGVFAADRGRISLDGRDVSGVPAERRGIGLVFQQAALVPHYSVRGNIEYGLRARRVAAGGRCSPRWASSSSSCRSRRRRSQLRSAWRRRCWPRCWSSRRCPPPPRRTCSRARCAVTPT